MASKQGKNQGNNQSDTSNRGFASMDPEKQREIASQGGRAAHASGNAHEFDSDEARRAGQASHQSGNAHAFNSQEAREAGSMSHKNDGNRQSGNQGSSGNQGLGGGTRGGTPEQHAEGWRQSHKNDKK